MIKMNKKTQKELLSLVKKNYEEIAHHYNETRKKKLGKTWQSLGAYASQARAGDRVLDVGCGNGRLLEAFERLDIKYLGVDSCEGLLECAKKQKPGNEFLECDILNLGEIKETNFDWVYSVAVLHHLPGQDLQVSALRQLRNKVSSHGKIIVTVWNMWSPKWQKQGFRCLIWKFYLLKLVGKNKMDFGDILKDWKNSQGEVVSKRYYHAFSKKELKKIVKKAGLKLVKISKDEQNYFLVLEKKT